MGKYRLDGGERPKVAKSKVQGRVRHRMGEIWDEIQKVRQARSK
jgi:hypothetical protein